MDFAECYRKSHDFVGAICDRPPLSGANPTSWRPQVAPTGLSEQGAPRRSARTARALRRLRLGFRLRNRYAISPLKMTRGGGATFGRSDDFACAKVMIGLRPSDVSLRGVMRSLRGRDTSSVACRLRHMTRFPSRGRLTHVELLFTEPTFC